MNESVNKDRVRLWVEALRNPELVQGRQLLAFRTTDKGDGPWQQCCLDVACRVAMDNGLELEEAVHTAVRSLKSGFKRGYRDARHSDTSPSTNPFNYTALPDVVAQWYGFGVCDVLMGKEGARFTAIDLNDGQCLTFPAIADTIEAEFLADKGEETS